MLATQSPVNYYCFYHVVITTVPFLEFRFSYKEVFLIQKWKKLLKLKAPNTWKENISTVRELQTALNSKDAHRYKFVYHNIIQPKIKNVYRSRSSN